MTWFITKSRARMLYQNKNWLCLICGATGSGKSFSALMIALLIDPTFNAERVVFKPEQLMELINSGKLKRGMVIVFDEAGTGIPSREWYSMSNKALNYLLQTFREMNIGVIFTTPDISFIDSQSRKLFHTYIETVKVDIKNKRVQTKVKEVQNNPQMGKIYYKYYRKKGKAIKKTFIGKPPKELLKAYKLKKEPFLKELNLDIDSDIKEVRKKAEPKIDREKRIVDEIMKNPDAWFRDYAGKRIFNLSKLEVEFDIGNRLARRIRYRVEHNIADNMVHNMVHNTADNIVSPP